MENPSEEFTKAIVKPVYNEKLTKSMRDKFNKIITQVFEDLINDKVEKRLGDALNNYKLIANSMKEYQEGENKDNYTLVEIEGYNIIRIILEDTLDTERLFTRKRKNYTSILIDNNSNYPIIRFYFNNKNLRIGLFDTFQRKYNNSRICENENIEDINDLFDYKDRIIKTTNHMLEEKKK